jgi:hypothetical protein
MDFMSIAAVICNGCVIAFTSDFINRAVYVHEVGRFVVVVVTCAQPTAWTAMLLLRTPSHPPTSAASLYLLPILSH